MKHLRQIATPKFTSGSLVCHPISLSSTYRDYLAALAAGTGQVHSAVDSELAQAILIAAFGMFDEAENIALSVLNANFDRIQHDEEVFFSLFHALAVIQRLDLAAALLKEKYEFSRDLELSFEDGTIGASCVRWEIPQDRSRYRFIFDSSILSDDSARTMLIQFKWIFPLIAHYANQPNQEFGSVYLNHADLGQRPGLAYSDARPEYFLIPDYIFVPTRGYAYARNIFIERNVPWNDRQPIAFWRGGTTGVPSDPGDWRTLDRIKLCETANRHSETGLFDVGFSAVVQIPDPSVIQWIETSGMILGQVPWEDWGRYKFLIDIDGNSSPWSNLFQKLLTGSPVLRVESRRNIVQWFYDDLIPWVNYVPIASDCSDLADKVQWLINHDDCARQIGINGLDLATKLTYEAELSRSIPVVSAAFRYFRGDTAGAAPFGRVSGRSLIYGRPVLPSTLSVLHTGGLGDILLATPALRTFKLHHPAQKLVFYGNYRDLLEGLPYIDELHPETDAPTNAVRLSYGNQLRLTKHIAKVFGDHLGIDVNDVTPDCAIDPALVEKYRLLFANLPRPWVVINRRASTWTPNKDWPDDSWSQLISRLRPLCGIVEVGNLPPQSVDDQEVAHINLVGNTSLSELVAVIAACDIVVTPVSGPMHIAAATHTPSVVIYGGYEQAVATAYQGNINLVSTPSCSPCWLREACPHDKKCLRDISVHDAEFAVWQAWAQIQMPAGVQKPLSVAEQADQQSMPNADGKESSMGAAVILGAHLVAPDWPVKGEPLKSFKDKLENGFFRTYMSGGVVIDVGFRGARPDAVPILPHAIGVDHGYPGYDGLTLPFANDSVDSVFSSHTLEHIADYRHIIRDWHRVTKIGGFIITIVPHQFLYEKRTRLPSRFNPEHLRYYTPASLLREFEEALEPNSYRVRHLRDNDKEYSYEDGPEHHGRGGYEIELVIEKIVKPRWELLDIPVPEIGHQGAGA